MKKVLTISIIIMALLAIFIIGYIKINSNEISELNIPNTIKLLEENNITIFGATFCGHCQNQLKQFGEYADSIKESGLFVYCDISNDQRCSDIVSVPSWKKDGEIIHVGYLELNQIKDKLNLNN